MVNLVWGPNTIMENSLLFMLGKKAEVSEFIKKIIIFNMLLLKDMTNKKE